MTDHVTAIAGSTERLSCSAVGHPAPQIVWYKDGVMLTVDAQQGHIVIDDVWNSMKTTSQLVLRGLVPADSGRYRCTALNSHGNVSFLYSLLVLGQFLQ